MQSTMKINYADKEIIHQFG